MRTRTISRRLSLLALGLVLASCSAAQPRIMEPSEPQELAQYALIIQELQDGRVEHVWKPLRDINLEPYRGAAERSSRRKALHTGRVAAEL